jgi:hypothetical protein
MMVFSQNAQSQKHKLIDLKVTLLDGSELSGILGKQTDTAFQVLGRKKKGASRKIEADSLLLNRWLKSDSIEIVRYRKNSSPKTGAAIGGGIGLIASLIIDSQSSETEINSVSGALQELDNGIDQTVKEVFVIVVGAGLGALIGSTYKEFQIRGDRDNFKELNRLLSNINLPKQK